MSLPCCQQTFCSLCIRQYLDSTTPRCPCCRAACEFVAERVHYRPAVVCTSLLITCVCRAVECSHGGILLNTDRALCEDRSGCASQTGSQGGCRLPSERLHTYDTPPVPLLCVAPLRLLSPRALNSRVEPAADVQRASLGESHCKRLLASALQQCMLTRKRSYAWCSLTFRRRRGPVCCWSGESRVELICCRGVK